MKLIAVTMRRDHQDPHGELRDAVDARWTKFLVQAQLTPLYMPNHLATVQNLVSSLPVRGVLLTGGGDIGAYGGKDAERDAVEEFLIDTALARHLPLLGVCRGMQAIQNHFGVPLQRIPGHVAQKHLVQTPAGNQSVNSYHAWGSMQSTQDLQVWARAEDGVVEAVRHASLPVSAVMWHPERNEPFQTQDLDLFRDLFAKGER